MTSNEDYFLYIWLSSLTVPELKVLGYNFNLSLQDKTQRTLTKCIHEYKNKLSQEYLAMVDPTNVMDALMNEISDTTIDEFKEILLTNSHETWHNYFEEQIITVKPSLRRFNIAVTTTGSKKTSKTCKTSKTKKTSKTNISSSSCPICLSNEIKPADIITTNCMHEYCSSCFSEYLNSIKPYQSKEPTCACCRENITDISVNTKELLYLYKDNYCRPTIVPKEPQPQPQSQSQPQSQLQSIITVIYNYIGF